MAPKIDARNVTYGTFVPNMVTSPIKGDRSADLHRTPVVSADPWNEGRNREVSRRLTTVLAALVLAAGALAPAAASAQTTTDDPTTTTASDDYVVITLNGQPAAADDATKTNGRFDPTSQGYAKALSRMQRQHERFAAQLAKVAPSAEIVDQYYVTANAVAVKLNGASLSNVAKISGVERTQTSNLYSLDMDQSVGLIGADQFWSKIGGADNAGKGVKVGVIDSGIDPSHPFFACKTIHFGGIYYSGVGVMPKVPALPAIAGPGYIPSPGDPFYFSSSHGTHVAGTIGGCAGTTITDLEPWASAGTTLSGVAPGAELYDYNVFPMFGAGYVAFGGSAFSHDIAHAIEDAVKDGMDVINMSLGGTPQGPHDFLAEVSNEAVQAGVVVVTSAGNEGPGSYTVGSPGSASEVIAVGASTNTRGMGVQIKVVDNGPTYAAVPGDFPDFDGSTYHIVDWSGTDNEACSAAGAGDHTGQVVVIARGTCSFSQKIANAKAAGAAGAIIYTYAGQDPIGMATTPGYDDQIPAVMVSYDAGKALEAGADAVITAPVIVPETPNLLADFSSRGPVPFTYAVKPDVVAPGVNILSSTVQFNYLGITGTSWELYNGTSMASPHVAGAAAALLGAHPTWTPQDVKSALVTTADATKPGGSVWEQGGGLISLPAADAAAVTFYPANASFGVFKGNAPANGSVDIAMSSSACSVVDTTGSAYASASIAGSTLTVDFTGARAAATGLYDGYVDVDCGTDGGYHLPWGAVVNR